MWSPSNMVPGTAGIGSDQSRAWNARRPNSARLGPSLTAAVKEGPLVPWSRQIRSYGVKRNVSYLCLTGSPVSQWSQISAHACLCPLYSMPPDSSLSTLSPNFLSSSSSSLHLLLRCCFFHPCCLDRNPYHQTFACTDSATSSPCTRAALKRPQPASGRAHQSAVRDCRRGVEVVATLFVATPQLPAPCPLPATLSRPASASVPFQCSAGLLLYKYHFPAPFSQSRSFWMLWQ